MATEMTYISREKDSRAGWVVVFSAFIGMMLSVGVLVIYTYGVLATAMASDLGWDVVDRNMIFVSYSLGSALFGPLWGVAADRIGARRIIIFSTVMLSICFVAIAAVPRDPVVAGLAFLAVGILAGGTLPPAFASIVVGWFDRFRGLALGATMLGVGVGAAVFPILAAQITEHFGWRITALSFAGMVFAVALPIAIVFLRPFPEPMVAPANGRAAGSRFDWSAFRIPRTWLMLAFAFFTGAVLVSCVANFVPLLMARNLSLTDAATYQSLLGAAILVGRLAGGAAFDRIFAPRVMATILLITAGGLLTLQFGSSSFAFAVAALGIGLSIGAEVDFLGFMISKYFDRSVFTTMFSLMFASYSLGATGGPIVFAALASRTGNYDLALTMCWSSIAVLMIAILFLPRYNSAQRAV